MTRNVAAARFVVLRFDILSGKRADCPIVLVLIHAPHERRAAVRRIERDLGVDKPMHVEPFVVIKMRFGAALLERDLGFGRLLDINAAVGVIPAA